MKSPRLFLPALALAALAGCARQAEPNPSTAANLPAVKVRVVAVRAETLPATIEVSGTVRPVQRARIAAKVMGAIEQLPVALGQRVRAGDLLAKISAGDTAARLAQAQAQLQLTRHDLDRERDLLAKNASTGETVRNLQDRLALHQAIVNEAEAMLGYATICAPFDGVVTRRLAYAGDLAAPGLPLLELEGTGSFEVEAAVPDSLAGQLATGTKISIALPTSSAAFAGVITELSPAADTSNRAVLAKISVPAGERVRSGEFARVQLPGRPVRLLLVPTTALSAVGQMERVFVAGEGSRAVLRLVKTGVVSGDRTEIVGGLDEGERIVAAPPATLREGQRLEVQP